MKVVAIAGLLAIAATTGLLARVPLSNLWGYRDGSVGIYLLFVLPALFICLVALVALRRREKPDARLSH